MARRPTLQDARKAYAALRGVDTADHTTQDGKVVKGTHAFKGRVDLRLAARRLLDKLEKINEAAEDDLTDKQYAMEDAVSTHGATSTEAREAQRAFTDALRQPLDDATFAEVDPERFGLRTSALGKKIIDKVSLNVWKDLGPWFVEDVPDDEVTEDGTANRAARRGGGD